MAFKHTHIISLSDGTTTLTGQIVVEEEGRNDRDFEIPASQTHLNLSYALTLAKNTSFFIIADKAMTVKVNSSGSPTKTLPLVANQAVRYTATEGGTHPLGETDVTNLYVTNTAAGTLKVRALINQ